MSETSYTLRVHPLPWDWQEQELSEGFSSIIYDANGRRPILDHLNRKEADVITRAVNAHASLCEAVEDCLNMVDGDGSPPSWDRVRAALSLARGEAK